MNIDNPQEITIVRLPWCLPTNYAEIPRPSASWFDGVLPKVVWVTTRRHSHSDAFFLSIRGVYRPSNLGEFHTYRIQCKEENNFPVITLDEDFINQDQQPLIFHDF